VSDIARLPEELGIPLPPSIAGSSDGGEPGPLQEPRDVGGVGWLPEELSIPLPPSTAGSSDGGEPGSLQELGDVDDVGRLPEELRIPLPPSAPMSDYGEPAGVVGNYPESAETGGDATQAMERTPGHPGAIAGSVQETAQQGVLEPPGGHRAEDRLEPAPPGASISSANAQERPSLASVMRAIRKDSYELKRRHALQNRLHSALHLCGSTERLIPIFRNLYHQMADSFKRETKTEFISLNNHLSSLRAAYLAATDLDRSKSAQCETEAHGLENPPWIWTDGLSHRAKAGLLRFVSNIRNDPSFLADRISRLSSFHLTDLALSYRKVTHAESSPRAAKPPGVFGQGSFRKSQSRTRDTSHAPFEIHRNPLFLLLHGAFEPMAAPGSDEYRRRLEAWSSVCAKVMMDGKAGSGGLCFAVLDAFSGLQPWLAIPQLEALLLDLMHSEWLASEPEGNHSAASSQSSRSQEQRNASQNLALLNDPLVRLIDLLSAYPPQLALPQSTLDLVHAILGKIEDAERRSKARRLILKWYSASFIHNAVTHPEASSIREPRDVTLANLRSRPMGCFSTVTLRAP
jgi:hypothetical protein